MVIAVLLVGVILLAIRLATHRDGPVETSADTAQVVESINTLCAEMQRSLQANEYHAEERDGVLYYYDNSGQLRCVYVPPESGGNRYARMLYFQNGSPIFAYYELTDSHSLYLKDDVLIRWRYCADKDIPEDSVNEDQTRSADYVLMESQVLQEANAYLLLSRN